MTTSGSPFVDRLRQRFGAAIAGANLEALDPWIEVAAEQIVAVCTYLRDEPDLRFNMLNCISAVDWCEPDPKKAAKINWQPRIEVVYHLWSLPRKVSLVLKVVLPRWKDGVAGQLPEVPAFVAVWPGADWHEREVYDLSGVRFTGHPSLRRILCPEDWVGHPLRKDYEMPAEYHGIMNR